MATPCFVSQYKGYIYKATDDTLLQTQFKLGVVEGVNQQTLWNGNPAYSTGGKPSPAAAFDTYYTHDAPWMTGGYGCITPRTSVLTQAAATSAAFTGPMQMVGSLETINQIGGIYIKLFPLEADRRIYIEPTTATNPGICRFRFVKNNTEHANVSVIMGNTCTIPWIEPLLNDNDHLYTYTVTLTVGGDGTGRVDRPGATVSNKMNWPLQISGTYNNLSTFFTGLEPIDEDDPYQDIPDSTPSGPAEGSGIPSSDPVDFPALPTFSVTDTGFVTLFNPTMAQVKNLADYMWNGLFDVNTFKKIFADPMDCILGFNMVPVAVPSGSAANINIGNIVTSVTMNIATSQWVELDCGSINIGLPYGSYLDFSPYTKFSIYLPYIGTFDLSTDDVAGNTLSLKYHVDTLSCSCVAYLKCGDHVLYQWTGACGYSIPVTQNDFSRMIMSIISIAAAGVGGAVTGGAGAAIMNAGASAAKNVMNLKPDVHRSGAIGSGAGLMGGQTPYLIIEIPNACKPKKQYHYTGYPGFITTTVGDLTGYAEFENVILDGVACTEEERSIIDGLLKGGVYI